MSHQVMRRSIALPAIELPTFCLLLLVYASWYALLLSAAEYGIIWFCLPLAYIVCLHSSLQHECLHGHPTRSQTFNDSLVIAPLILWLPYISYKRLHLEHHACHELTHPEQDPESYYFDAAHWQHLGGIRQKLHTLNNTLAGRMLIGPWLCIYSTLKNECREFFKNPAQKAPELAVHLLGLAGLFWLIASAGLAWLDYALWVIWPATSLMLLRSYYEHRPAADNKRSTAIIESNAVLSLLYLNNNYHLVHHRHPRLPWYRIRDEYEQKPDKWQAINEDFMFLGYGSLWKRFALAPKDSPLHQPRANKE